MAGKGDGGRGVLERGGGGGSGTQKLVYQKWPDQISPFVDFVSSHGGPFGLQGGGGPGDGGLTPCVTFRRVFAPLRGPGQSPVRPFACCVGSLRSVGRCGRCSCWCRFRVRGAQWLVCWGCAGCSGAVCSQLTPSPPAVYGHSKTALMSSDLQFSTSDVG